MIEVNNFIKSRISLGFSKSVIQKVKRKMKIKRKIDISIALVGERTIRRLNKIYRGMDEVTDVLSFNYSNFRYPKVISGEIVICYPKIKKQAKKIGHSIKREMEILLIHGMFHLLGYNHITKKEEKKMRELEKRLLV